MAAKKRVQGAVQPMPEFIPFQLCKLVDRPPSGDGWLHEVKFDGYRMQVRVEGGRPTIRTRKGYDWTRKFRHLEAVAGELPDVILDGELCAIGENGQPDFSELQASIAAEQTDELVFYAFDLLWDGREDLRPYAIGTRKARLRAIIEDAGDAVDQVIRFVEPVSGSPAGLLKAACELELEGIVSKRLGENYRSGRGATWTKAKCRPSLDVVVGGWRQGSGGFRVMVGVPEPQGGLRYIGSIGSGYSSARLSVLMPALKDRETTSSPFSSGPLPKSLAGVRWVRPDLVAEIEAAEINSAGKLRQASFKGVRPDKSVGDLRPLSPGMQNRVGL